MRKESVHKRLERVRPPRVHITYDVEIGDAIELKELPFVVGVLGDLSGKPEEPLPRLRDRKFVEIDGENFDAVMKGMKPRLAFTVENKLTDDRTKIGVELQFNSIEDFEPGSLVRQVEPLRKLLETRIQLRALLGKAYANERLSDRLQEIISNTELLQRLSGEAGLEPGGADEGAPKEKANE